MSGISEIRQHIKAIEQTRKITGAMEMVSSNRMRKVMGHIEQNNRYFKYVRRMMKELLTSSHDVSHRYLQARPGGHCTYVVIAGDKGLCGAHNTNVLNFALSKIRRHQGATIITMGNTAESYFHAHGIIPDITLLGIVQDPTLTRARTVAMDLMRMFDDGLTDEIHVIFTSFYGKARGKPYEFRLLPIVLHDYSDVTDAEPLTEILYHPSAQIVFDNLVPQYMIGLIFGVMVQSYASEHFARMNAMHSATTNAQDMLYNLRAKYNLARQSAITNEIAEITGAAEVQRGDQKAASFH